MNLQFPQYENCLLALTSSILRHFGAACPHPSLPLLDQALQTTYRNVVVLLLDGMGTAVLQEHLDEQAFFRRNLRAEISSVFPPTTAAATTTMESGLSPAEHGWLGWSLYFKEIHANVDIFPNVLSGSDTPAADYHMASRYLPYTTIYNKIRSIPGCMAYQVSPFGEIKTDSFDNNLKEISILCNKPGQKYIYSYWTEPDSSMHKLGVSHPNVKQLLHYFSTAVEELCHSLSDTLFIVTADHGMMDVQYRYLGEMPRLMDCLTQLPYVESRAMMFHVKENRKDEFEKEFDKEFGWTFRLFTRQEIENLHLFGEGIPHSRYFELIGDYLGVAFGKEAIDVGMPNHSVLTANHAGMTAAEMNIPLIIADCR